MKTENLPRLVLRCFAERHDDQWQAFCIDLSLAAQADTFEEVKGKLESQMVEYVHDALVGADRDYAEDLLYRKSPLSIRGRYYWYRALSEIHFRAASARDNLYRLFDEPLPMEPADFNGRPQQRAC